jgi:hypothetical protein
MHCRATSPVLREFRHPAFATPDPASQGHHKGITGASPLHHAAKQRIAEFAVWALPRPTRFLTIHIFIYVVFVCRFSSALFASSLACLAPLFSLLAPSAAPVYHPTPRCQHRSLKRAICRRNRYSGPMTRIVATWSLSRAAMIAALARAIPAFLPQILQKPIPVVRPENIRRVPLPWLVRI